MINSLLAVYKYTLKSGSCTYALSFLTNLFAFADSSNKME